MGLTDPDPYSDVWRRAFIEPTIVKTATPSVSDRCRLCTRDERPREDHTAYEVLEIWRRGHVDRQVAYKSFHQATNKAFEQQVAYEEGE